MQRMSMDEECAGCEMSAKMIEKFKLKLKGQKHMSTLFAAAQQPAAARRDCDRQAAAQCVKLAHHKSQVKSHKSQVTFVIWNAVQPVR